MRKKEEIENELIKINNKTRNDCFIEVFKWVLGIKDKTNRLRTEEEIRKELEEHLSHESSEERYILINNYCLEALYWVLEEEE